MKLIVAIVHDEDSYELGQVFGEKKISATRLKSTGSFLRSGNTTFLIGAEDDRVNDILAIIEEHGQHRSELIAPTSYTEGGIFNNFAPPVEVAIGGATVFVLPIESFFKF
ncbi:cyclic-di-AMP receptor [Atopobacter phocae]|uniref:cyclic-di-AMP receptor n=1 Tax=Atopobacter phocae TaxID=136492 RepID=UPI00046E9B23|nr:cyclic-di-AMP receptor [Atopobacter phocae]